MFGYIISCIVLSLIIVAFIPAMIASRKSCRFTKWYLYGIVLFPVAFVHSLLIKKPIRVITVYSTAKDGGRKKKTYRAVPVKRNKRKLSFGYVAFVFLTKLLSGAFAAFISFAIMRMYLSDTDLLRIACSVFAVVLAAFMTVTQVFGFSRVPFIADEMTKRALIIMLFSVVISAVMSVVKILLTSNISEYREFFRFLCTVISFAGFLFLLLKMQGYYCRIYYGFFDYCVLTVGSYGMYTSVMLVMLSVVKKWRFVVYALSMPMQMFNFSYFENINYIEQLSAIYSAAFVHIIIAVLILLSGLGCYNYRRKELLFRAEYRSKAFRMSRRQALRRHIPKSGLQISKTQK